jgi:hypothetical protein
MYTFHFLLLLLVIVMPLDEHRDPIGPAIKAGEMRLSKPHLRPSGGVAAFLRRLIPPTAGLRF